MLRRVHSLARQLARKTFLFAARPQTGGRQVRRLLLEVLESRETPAALADVSGSFFAATVEPAPDGLLSWKVTAPVGSPAVEVQKFGLSYTPDRALVASAVTPGELNPIITRPEANGLTGWYINTNADPAAEVTFGFGFSTDTTLFGDVADIGKSIPVAVRQEANGALGWYGTLDFNSTAEFYAQYGKNGGKPLLGDVNGDRHIDLIVAYAQPSGLLKWEADTNHDGVTDWVFAEYGFNSDEITMADVNSDGRPDIGVFRRNSDGSLHGLFNLNSDKFAEVDVVLGGASARPVVLPSEPIGDFATDSFRGVWHWQQGTTHRGTTIKPPMLVSESALDALRAENVNIARVMLIKELGSPADYGTWLNQQLAFVDQSLNSLRAHGISIILALHTAPGSALAGEPGRTDGPFVSATYRQQFLDTWRVIARRYATTDVVVGFDLLNEPRTNSPSAWNALAKDTHNAIRGEGGRNATRTIVIESRYGHADNISELRPQDFVGQNVVFSFHAYDPLQFTHFGLDKDFSTKLFTSSVRSTIDRTLVNVRSWQVKNRVRIYVGEFAASFPANVDLARKQAVADFLAYSTAKFEGYGWQWTYHSFREATTWDLELNFAADTALWNRSTIRARFANNPVVF